MLTQFVAGECLMNTPRALVTSGSRKHAYGFAFHWIRNTLVARQLLTTEQQGCGQSLLMYTDVATQAFPSESATLGRDS